MKVRYAWGIALLVLLPVLAGAFQPKTDKTDLNQKEFFLPELYISSSTLSLQEISGQLKNQKAWNQFFAANGADFHVYFDPRSATAVNIMGSIPLIPGDGKGNRISLADVSRKLGRRVDHVDAAVIAGLFDNWVRANARVLGVDASQLGPARAAEANSYLWHLNIPQIVNGIPVRYARVLAAVNHGNMVIAGAENWSNVRIDTTPRISAAQARELGFSYAGGMSDKDIVLKEPSLEIIPYAPREFTSGEGFAGPVGSGYGHRLCWIFEFQRAPELARWEVMVDAHTAEVIAFQDTNHYVDAKISGGTYPLTNTEICPDNIRCGIMNSDQPMPFADIGGGLFTNSAGHYNYTSGTTTTTFSGRYVDMTDTCGAPSFSGAGDINLGGTNGQHDCTTPTSGGNTAATRSGMFEMNKIFEEARGYLPGNLWLQGNQTGPLPTNMNIVNTCNAFYSSGDPGSVNFYRTGGGCRNTGEIAAVFDHEWGHGMDDHDTGGALSSSSEGYADIASMYRLWASCVGYGFFETADRGCGTTADGTGFNQNEAQTGPSHCDTDCSGVRDSDWAKHVGGAPDTVTFTCASCLSGSGPCGRQVHCAATPVRQMAWDFVARDLQGPPYNYDANTAFILGDKIFYQGSGNVGSWHNCTCPSTSDGCAAANGYPNWLAADDDNGNLSDGTPHMTAIFNAYNRHGIACAAPTVQDSGCGGGPTTPPSVTASPGNNQVTLNWGAVAGAVKYNVYRGEGYAGCEFGKALIGSTIGANFSDTEVGNNRVYSYVVMAEGADDACFTPASTCVQATPVPCAGAVSLDKSSYSCSDTIAISLVDADLQGNGTQTVDVASTLETTPEVVTLNESPANSGQFSGTIATTSAPPVAANGVLSIANGDTITVTYHDASFCGPAQDVSGNSTADCAAPAISNVQAINLTDATATITWDTNELGNSRVTYAAAPGPPSTNQDDLSNYVLAHSVNLSGLNQCSDYVFSVTSSDTASNSITDDNGGSFYNFTTTGIGFLLNDDIESGSPSWTAAGTVGSAFHISTCDASSPTHAWKAGNTTCAAQYGNNVTTTLTSASGYEIQVGSRLRYNERVATESGFDFCRPQISTNGGGSWTDLDSYSGTIAWRSREYDLSAFAGSNRLIRFQFTSDVTVTAEGWFIDDIQVTYPAPCGTSLAFGGSAITDDCSGGGPGDGDGVLDPGETADVQVTTNNTGLLGATNVTAVLSTVTAGVTILDNTASFPDIPAGGSGVSIAPHFRISAGPGVPCGTIIDFTINYSANEGNWSDNFTLAVGTPTNSTTNYVSTDVPKAILDLQTVDSVVNVSDTGSIVDVNVTLSITHSFDADLDIFLVGPGGSPIVELSTDNGSSGSNMINTVFDDEAATSITAGTAPFTGTFRPEGLLSTFDGMPANGTWTLRTSDDANLDTGTLTAWSLELTTQNGYVCNNCGQSCPAITLSPGALPGGNTGSAYNQVITASGGVPPYIFTTGDPLPAGITLATDGTLSGTPTASGTFNLAVTATDSNGCTGQQAYSLVIGTCLFCDDFEDGITAANWTYIKPAWNEASGVLTATPAGKKAVAVATPAFAGCSSCYMEGTLQSGGGTGSIVWMLGWYVDKKNTVELLMKEQNDKWLLKERINGAVVGKAKSLQPINPNTLYRARITFDGTQFQVFIDGNLAITLPSHGAHNGTVGFQAKGTIGTFGEVIVN